MTKQRKHKKRSTIKRKHRRMKQHAEAKKLDSKELAKEYGPYRIGKAGK